MTTTAYTSRELVNLNRQVRRPEMFLTDMLFSRTRISDRELFDMVEETDSETMARLVCPDVPANVVTTEGSFVKSIKPAYVKEKCILDPCDYSKLTPEEMERGIVFSPYQRRENHYAKALMKLQKRELRTIEWMAAQILVTGKLEITPSDANDKYPPISLDFGRDPAKDITLAGADLWSASTSTLLEDMEDFSMLTLQDPTVGLPAMDFIVTPDVLKAMKRHQDYIDLYDRFRGVSQVPDLAPKAATRVRFEGMLGQFRLWVYGDWYNDGVNPAQPYLPAGTVLAVVTGESGFNGGKGFGAIKDHQSLVATRQFVSSWIEHDPSRLYLMCQSAPILFPGRINACVKATVL